MNSYNKSSPLVIAAWIKIENSRHILIHI